jgi:hypothetical protein
VEEKKKKKTNICSSAKINETDTFEGGEDEIPFEFADTIGGPAAPESSDESADEIGMSLCFFLCFYFFMCLYVLMS